MSSEIPSAIAPKSTDLTTHTQGVSMKTNLGDEFRAVAMTMKLLAATSQDKRGVKLLEKLRLKIYQEMLSTLHEDPFLRIVSIPEIRCHDTFGVEKNAGLVVVSHPCMGDTALIAAKPEDTPVPRRWEEVRFAQLGERVIPFMSPCECCQRNMDEVAKFIIRNGFKRFTMSGERGVKDGRMLGRDDPYRYCNLRFLQFDECEWIMQQSA